MAGLSVQDTRSLFVLAHAGFPQLQVSWAILGVGEAVSVESSAALHPTRRPHIQLRMQGSCVTLAHCTAPTSDAVMIAIWRSSSTSQCDQPRRVQPKLLYRCRNTVCGGIAVALSCFHQLCTNHHPAGLTLITRTPRLGRSPMLLPFTLKKENPTLM